MAPTVNSPNGGKADFLRMNLSECLKLQKVSGNAGYNNKAFMRLPFQFRIKALRLRRFLQQMFQKINSCFSPLALRRKIKETAPWLRLLLLLLKGEKMKFLPVTVV
jgi:hypothetical protein